LGFIRFVQCDIGLSEELFTNLLIAIIEPSGLPPMADTLFGMIFL